MKVCLYLDIISVLCPVVSGHYKNPQLLDDKIYYPYIPKVNKIFFENYGVCTNGPFTDMEVHVHVVQKVSF